MLPAALDAHADGAVFSSAVQKPSALPLEPGRATGPPTLGPEGVL